MINQEQSHLFLCSRGRMLPRWSEAFHVAKAGKLLTVRNGSESDKVDVVWLRLERGLSVEMQLQRVKLQFKLTPCVVLSDLPSDEEALVAFSEGAKGYCNTHATAHLLVQIATVVMQGGLWIGESLMQRLVGATSRLQATAVSPSLQANLWSRGLTEREKEVASTLARGASNKEIARTLGITERTVKSHVGAILEKLQVRDRLQLSVMVNSPHSST